MTKLNWERQQTSSILNSEYYTNPKTGFDKAWHLEQAQKKANVEKEKQFLGIHQTHNLDRIQLTSGPHSGKLICKTCNNKFLKWLPKEAL
jgi:uncharacterized membrane protein YfhO